MIRSLQIRGFRSIENSGLDQCGGLNVLIGKNNAGKSNVLSAIELVVLHLKQGRVAGSWPTARPTAEFTDRDQTKPLRIGMEFDLPPDINEGLRTRLTKEAPHLDRSIEQIKAVGTIAFILAGAVDDSEGYLFIEQMSVGRLNTKGEDIATEGIRLLSVTRQVALELHRNLMAARAFRSDIQILEELLSSRRPPLEYILQQPKDRRALVLQQYAPRMKPETSRQLGQRVANATSFEEIESSITQTIAEAREKVEALERRETEGTISAFAGEAKTPPVYAEWLMEQFGKIPFMHIKERKQEIGREEAETLLRLKVRRGGPDRLDTIQQTIKSLLGVRVDAFEAEAIGSRGAEMDVDDFLIEANGAGIREALRIILDLELKNPRIVLIEEPEVHLHPGLSRVVAGYLQQRSQGVQMFVTTHSTDFVDLASFQNVFLVSRDHNSRTICQPVIPEEGASKIPAELGLRLSTVFMFDKLIFVEGPSDESVFRVFAKATDVDLTKANVGFVYMNGVRNFAYFAAESTLDLLSRRRIQMWFVTDRDESTDAEVLRMTDRLAGRARLTVLEKRELENYLLNSTAITSFITDKQKSAGSSSPKPDVDTVARALTEEADALKGEVIRLRLEKRLLMPVFLQTRTAAGAIPDRIRNAVEALNQRLEHIEQERAAITADVESSWHADALSVVPGSAVLEKVARRFGVGFSKDKGDSEKLALQLSPDAIPSELKLLLREIVIG